MMRFLRPSLAPELPASTMLARAGLGVVEIDLRSDVVRVAESLAAELGYTCDELNGPRPRWAELVHPEDQAMCHALFDGHVRGETQRFSCEHRKIRRDGSITWMLAQGCVERDSAGIAMRYVGIDTCVDEYRQARRRAADSRLLTESIARTVPALVYVYDFRRGQIIWTNTTFEQFFGLGASEHSPLPMGVIEPRVHPDDRTKIQAKFDPHRRHAMGNVVAMEVRLTNASGDVRWLRCNDSVYETDEEYRPLRAVGIAADITEQRQTEAALRASEDMFRRTAEHMGDTLYILDRSGQQIHFLNAAVTSLTGRPVDELMAVGMSEWFGLVDARDRVAVKNRFDAWVTSGDPNATSQQEYRLRRTDGTVRWVNDRVFAITDEAGRIVRYAGLCTDITDRKRAERRLRRRDAVLKRLVKRRSQRVRDLEHQRAEQDRHVATGRMAARIAHEINNPLAGVKSALRLVRTAVPQEHPHHHYGAKIEGEIDRIARIVKQMYTLYRPEAETPRPLDLEPLVNDLLAMLSSRMEKSGVAVVFRKQGETGPVLAPETGLREVLVNLLANAIEASRAGSTVVVEVHLQPGRWCLRVIDQGCGISDEIRDRVFEPFFSTKGSHDGAGMGLGLSVTRSLVVAMGGEITFTSQSGFGTMFQVCLPDVRTEETR